MFKTGTCGTRSAFLLSDLPNKGNLLARQELMELIGYTIEPWIEHHEFLARWRGYEEELRRQVEGCILRYRYAGSFIRNLFKTLEYAARGIRPLIAYALDEPLLHGKAQFAHQSATRSILRRPRR
jgi:hypothetical protein